MFEVSFASLSAIVVGVLVLIFATVAEKFLFSDLSGRCRMLECFRSPFKELGARYLRLLGYSWVFAYVQLIGFVIWIIMRSGHLASDRLSLMGVVIYVLAFANAFFEREVSDRWDCVYDLPTVMIPIRSVIVRVNAMIAIVMLIIDIACTL